LGASITDSDNNTVNTPLLDLGLTFATDLELSNAITTAVTGLNLTQYAKQSDLTDSINALNISQYVKTTEMADAISAATSNFVSQTDMTNAISALNLSQYATTGNLAALATRVSALETASADHEGRISALETSAASGYVTGTDLSTALNGYYAKSQTYSQSETDNLLTEKQDTLPACADGQVIKYNTVTSAWECAGDLNTVSPDLSSYATESWVQSQGYAATTALNELLPNNLLAGVGISLANNNGVITINSTAQTDVFEVVSDHTAVAAPNPNKIYIDTGTNPASQWVYENSAWVHIGEVNAELTDYFTKTQTESTISSAIAANNGNYTTTSALTPLLAAKQDKLPACADGQVAKYVLASDSWVCGDDNNTVADLSEYAKEAWVSGQIATNNNSYTTTTDLTALLGNKADKSALAATDDALADETTDRTEADTALADRLDTIESDYLKSSSLGGYVTTGQISDMATKTWVNGEGFLKSGDLSGYATESFVTGKGYITSSALSGYATTTALTTATTDMATNAGVSSGYVAKSALNCSSTQALVGTGTNGTISCRAITNITSGSLTSNTNLITASTLNTVLGNYYTKTELDTKLQKMATGADGPIIFKVVTSMPAPSDQDPNTVYLLKGQ
jgi:hypothetical protein